MWVILWLASSIMFHCPLDREIQLYTILLHLSDPTDQQYECDHDRNTTERCDTNMRYDLKDGANCDENMRYEIKDGSYCDARDDARRSNSDQTTTGCRVNDINSSNGVSHSSCYCANIVGAHAQDDAHPTSGRTEEMVSKLTRKLNTLENYAETLQLQLAKKDWDLEKQIRKNALLMEQLEKYRSIIKRIQDVWLLGADDGASELRMSDVEVLSRARKLYREVVWSMKLHGRVE